MCVACKDMGKVYDANQELLTAFFTDINGDPNLLLCQGNRNPQSVRIKIQFCPWCGRYLREPKAR